MIRIQASASVMTLLEVLVVAALLPLPSCGFESQFFIGCAENNS